MPQPRHITAAHRRKRPLAHRIEIEADDLLTPDFDSDDDRKLGPADFGIWYREAKRGAE